MPLEVEQSVITKILQASENPVILELGGHHGTDTTWLYWSCNKQPRMIVLEPDARNCEIVERKALNMPGVRVLRTAIAAKDGYCDFYACDNTIGKTRASSSIRKPKRHLEFFPWCTFSAPEKVPCITLDSLVQQYNLDHVDVIWADVQGAERDMIEGGPQTLAKTRYLFTEYDDNEFYEGQADRRTLLEMLPDWEIVQVFDFNVLLRNKPCT